VDQRLGKFIEAERLYLEVLAKEPGRSEAMLNLGNLYLRTGRMNKAVLQYRRILYHNPDSFEAHLNLGATLWAIDVLECPRCLGRMRILAAIHPPDAIRAILDCLGLPSRAPPIASAAGRSSSHPDEPV
jgi:tetratricopeptide (TPR) repeat protein